MNREKRYLSRDRNRYVIFVALALVLGLLGGILGATLGVRILSLTGPIGPQGDKGDTGDTGTQGDPGPRGLQGVPGINGTDSILNIVQQSNDSQIDTASFSVTRWYNLSVVDPSMRIVVNVHQDSKLFLEFSGVQTLSPPESIWVRIVVDNALNSSRYVCSTGPPASGTYTMSGHVEFLTPSLNAGPHTVDVQFWIVTGSPVIVDRSLTVMEVSA